MAKNWAGPALRVGVFALIATVGLFLWGTLLYPLGLLIAATISVFGSGAVASALALRIYEAGSLTSIGFGWHKFAGRNLGLGFLLGAGGIVAVIGIPLLIGKAKFVATPDTPFNLASLGLVAVCLLFGAIGEELLFRGYAFQVLAGTFGTYQVLLPIAVLFAAMHSNNLGSSPLALLNTFLWGVLLGYGLLRSGDLWLPIGMHFGWNVTTPLFGVNLSGFTMGMTGYTLEWKATEAWSGGAYGPEGSVLCTLAAFGIGYLLFKAPIERQRLPLLPEEDE